MKKIILALIVLCFGLLVSCVPFTAESCEKKMERKGYEKTTSNLVASAIKLVSGVTVDKYYVFTKTINEGKENEQEISVHCILLLSNEDAEKVGEDVNEWGSAFIDEDDLIKYSGKWVYFGADQAIKDFEALI